MVKKAHRVGGLKKGDILKNKYEILALIGEGGMSRVFLARDLELVNKQWAIKEVDRNAKDPMGRPIEQSLASEAELLSKLSHPAIVDIVDIERTENYIYVVMDHIEGVSLDKVVRQKGPQKEEDVQEWMLEICDALGYLHRQNPPIIYRDVKPNNIMLHPDGYVKLIDLGVAREYKDEQKKDTIAFGTTGYAAPEQYGKSQTDARTDVYGLGATMWHLLAGTAPPVEFPLPNVRTENPQVGEGFADVIIPKSTALERNERYQTVDELMADLSIYQELTKEFRDSQKKKVRSFAGCVITSVACLLIGFISLGARAFQTQQIYENHIVSARSATGANWQKAENEYIAAIEAKPDETEPYEKLLDCYIDENGSLTQEDSEIFLGLYNAHVGELKNNPNFGNLAYKIGGDYWFDYEYGKTDGDDFSGQLTRMKAAEGFFNTAVEQGCNDKETAEMFADLANLLTRLSSIDKENKLNDKEVYPELWENLTMLASKLKDESNQARGLDECVLLISVLSNYLDYFKSSANVNLNSVESVVTKITEKLMQLSFPNDEAKEMLKQRQLLFLKQNFQNRLSATYSQNISPGGA